jgi:cellulose synthase/poly-beta-1,6-N-acetylglucosamine synthase-like glycosyltransferase
MIPEAGTLPGASSRAQPRSLPETEFPSAAKTGDKTGATPRHEDLAVVILARDEADVLEATLRSLVSVSLPGSQIHVVADHCRDRTAQVAHEAGALVHVRSGDSEPGKGPALRWWLERTREPKVANQAVVVLDADGQVAPGFFTCICKRLRDGSQVVQARIEPRLQSDAIVSRLAAYSEIVEQRVFDSLRARLGWPVRLRGTGMAFRRPVLEDICVSLHTLAEDLEMTLLLGARGVPITYAPETFVTDPKPENQAGAVRQRARWLKGQVQVFRDYPRQVLRLALRGAPGWSLLASLLLKPKTLLLPLATGLVAAAWFAVVKWGGVGWLCLSSVGTIYLALEAAAFLYCLRFVPDRVETALALAASPVYFGMWLKSLALSLVSERTWLRTRPGPMEGSGGEGASAE